ncbi:MAG: TRASH domain-containing protein [Thermodesulfobacteriota bacterium]
MNTIKKTGGIFAALCVLLLATGAQIVQAESSMPTANRVEKPSRVCMVNNMLMASEMIPVEVDGKTYYGCCPMCAGRIKKDFSIRHATDPITGNQVDKAEAVMAFTDEKKILYFESEESYAKYKESAPDKEGEE